MIEAVIFDIDGTLVDSVSQHAAAWHEALLHFHKDVPFADVKKQIGKGDDQLLPMYFTAAELDHIKADIVEYRARLFKAHYLSHIKPFPGVRSLFIRLRADGRRVALASSASQDDVRLYQEIADISDLVEEAATKNDVEHSKPSPDIFAAALERLANIAPDQAVAVGDTPWDSLAAGALGIMTIGVQSGGWPQGELKKAGCTSVYRDVEEILREYDRTPLRVQGHLEQKATSRRSPG